MQKLSLVVFGLVSAAACSAPTVINNVSGAGAAMQEKGTADKVESFASRTPPSNGRSMGTMSSPRAGNVTVPITNVEVYVFTANVDDDASDETLYWAADEYTVYVWGEIGLECVDEYDEPTGETGAADFIFEADDYGYGWMVSTDSCGYTTIYGCSDDGAGEVCGGCDFDDSYIVCVEEY